MIDTCNNIRALYETRNFSSIYRYYKRSRLYNRIFPLILWNSQPNGYCESKRIVPQ